MHFRSLLASGLLALAPLFAGDKVFTPDTNHTVIGFTAATVLFDVPGRFDRYKIQISGDPDAPARVSVKIEIDTKSVFTSNKMRDDHLRSDDFFDASAFPKIVFTSTTVRRNGNQIVVQGTLDMHGKKKDLQITFEEAKGLNGAGTPTWSYKATLPINRQDFDIGAESVAAKISLKDEVRLNLLLVGFFEDPKPEAGKKGKAGSKRS